MSPGKSFFNMICSLEHPKTYFKRTKNKIFGESKFRSPSPSPKIWISKPEPDTRARYPSPRNRARARYPGPTFEFEPELDTWVSDFGFEISLLSGNYNFYINLVNNNHNNIKMERKQYAHLRDTKFINRGWRYRQSWFSAKCFLFGSILSMGKKKVIRQFLRVFFQHDMQPGTSKDLFQKNKK